VGVPGPCPRAVKAKMAPAQGFFYPSDQRKTPAFPMAIYGTLLAHATSKTHRPTQSLIVSPWQLPMKFPLFTIIINCEGWRRKSGSFRLFYTFYMHHCIPGIRCLTCPCPCPFRCPCPNAREQLPGSGFWARVRVRVKGLSGLSGGCYASAPSSGQFPMHIECLWDADHA